MIIKKQINCHFNGSTIWILDITSQKILQLYNRGWLTKRINQRIWGVGVKKVWLHRVGHDFQAQVFYTALKSLDFLQVCGCIGMDLVVKFPKIFVLYCKIMAYSILSIFFKKHKNKKKYIIEVESINSTLYFHF